MRGTRAAAGWRQQQSGCPELVRLVPGAGRPAPACNVGGCVTPPPLGCPSGNHLRTHERPCGRAGVWGAR